jgi:hypothetical protein
MPVFLFTTSGINPAPEALLPGRQPYPPLVTCYYRKTTGGGDWFGGGIRRFIRQNNSQKFR